MSWKGRVLRGVALGDLAQGGYEPMSPRSVPARLAGKRFGFGAILVAGDCGSGLVCGGPGVRGPVR